MSGIECLLLGAAFCILASAVAMVVRVHLTELSAERESAQSMVRIANTLAELDVELAPPTSGSDKDGKP